MIQIHGEPYLDAEEAAELMGVKPATLYAYVSRGVLASYRQGHRRKRLYKEHDIRNILRLRPSRQPALPHAADWVGDP